MKLSTSALVAAALPLVLAGLEDAKYSTVLTPQNFDSSIASKSEGSLVAFFAPWCGHCKSLEPVWTKIAQQFEGDDRCQVAHFNADDADARPISGKYGVSGFPTIKFLAPPSKGGAAEAYQGPRTEEAFLEFLNDKCGTHKLPGGVLSDLAGRIPSLDSIASQFLGPSATRPDLAASASAIASSLTPGAVSSSLSAYYLRIFDKFSTVADTEGVTAARAWVDKERERLAKLAGKKGQVTAAKLEELHMKRNVLAAFAEARDVVVEAASSASSVVGEATASASSLASGASKSASSAASVASKSAGSAASVVSSTVESVVGQATASASSVASDVSKSASSVGNSASSASSVASKSLESAASVASSTVGSVVGQVTASASSLASGASKSVSSVGKSASSAASAASSTAGSVVDQASSSASSVYVKATGGAASAYERVKEEL
ncbi:hypothetical protein JCM8208_000286 [Rhodotorula glutinis]